MEDPQLAKGEESRHHGQIKRSRKQMSDLQHLRSPMIKQGTPSIKNIDQQHQLMIGVPEQEIDYLPAGHVEKWDMESMNALQRQNTDQLHQHSQILNHNLKKDGMTVMLARE